jgi:coenzyme F420-reducing hydrogenase delta subunit
VEPGRLHFSWISSAEATKYVAVAKEVAQAVREAGPANRLVKKMAGVA